MLTFETFCISNHVFFFFLRFFSYFFFSQSGKIRRSRVKFQYVIVSVISDGITGRWLAALPASCRGGEGRERVSGALYVRLCGSPGSGWNAQARREANSDNNQHRALDIIYTVYYRSTEQERTQADSIQFITVAAERTWKVWRNAVSVPAPDQPAVCLQQPAG